MSTPATHAASDRDVQLDRLAAAWRDAPGLAGWLGTVDHKRIAWRYFATGAGFLALDLLLWLLLRTQLAEAEHDLLGRAVYRQVAEMHGMAALLLGLVPMVLATALYLVPLMLGARAIAFARLNAFGYWLFLCAGAVDLTVFGTRLWAAEAMPAARALDTSGWHSLPVGLSALCVALGVLGTAARMRAPGLTWSRVPGFVWAMVVGSVLVLLVVPADALSTWSQARPAPGAESPGAAWSSQSAVLALLLLPVLGLLSGIVETTARRPMAWPVLAHAALLLAGVLVLGRLALPWLGVDDDGGLHTLLRAGLGIATGVLAACWLATLARRAWRTEAARMPEPLLYLFGALVFGATGAAGHAIAAVRPAWAGSYAEAAWFHCIAGAGVFALLGGVQAWFPKATGRMLSASIARLQFALLFGGTLAAFLPMFWLGAHGMARRLHAYDSGLGWVLPNTVATLGAWAIVAGAVLLAFNIYYALRQGRPAGDNPWRAHDLAWATHSPPPPYNFAGTPSVADPSAALQPDARGLEREVQLTSPLRAVPTRARPVPHPGLLPLALAVIASGLIAWSRTQADGVAWTLLLLLGAAATAWHLRGHRRVPTRPV